MYQALYRKYRPKTFEEVVGQDHVTKTLRRQVETGRLSHAYLFIGTRGTGKTTCARILAKAVNCEHPVHGSPCNECAACRGIDDGSIMDVVELDAASNNRVDDVRALQDEAIFSPASAKKRVYIIDEVHMLSTAAFNALLKILEEPPEHLMFILCTTELRKVLPTIVSRCQRHNFTRIDAEDIARQLLNVAAQEKIDLTTDAAALLSRLAGGGMRDALSLLDQCGATEHIGVDEVYAAIGMAGSRRTAELLEAVRVGSTEKALTIFDELWRDGKDPAGILDELAGLMRDVLLLQVAPHGGLALLSGLYESKTLQYFAAKFSGSELMDGVRTIHDADLAGTNPRRAAEMCLVSLCVPETGQSLEGLRTRVSRLEAVVQKGGLLPPLSSPEERQDPPDSQPTGDNLPWDTDDAPKADARAYAAQAAGKALAEAEEKLPRGPEPTPAEPAPTEEAQRAGEAASEEKMVPADEDVWASLVKRLEGKMDLAHYSMLQSPNQVTGGLVGDKLTVCLLSPIAAAMVNNPADEALLRSELKDMLGRDVAVVFQAVNAEAARTAPNMEKLSALAEKYPNFKIV